MAVEKGDARQQVCAVPDVGIKARMLRFVYAHWTSNLSPLVDEWQRPKTKTEVELVVVVAGLKLGLATIYH